ncbi:unnamed protein product [Rhizoctonia solani]|uniref:Uncharacterized protein n=1 Tax=Rhizoctonia solani TaxID=456999 RepID=A0A8H2XVF3_9AGAM|nr:unnamed protein product [Rhizoctonia solani]
MSDKTYVWAVDPTASQFVGALLVLLLVCYWSWPVSRRKGMPPGPASLPIIGNAYQLKPVNVYAQFRSLNEKYGPLASLKIGSSNMIVIGGDGTLVRELLDKRGAIYSNRPQELVNDIAGRGDHLLFQRDTNKWRTPRKLIVQHYSSRVSKDEHVRLQEAESVQLLYDFLHQPTQFMEHVMRYLPDFMMMNWKSQAKKVGELMDKVYGDLVEIGRQRGISGLNTNTLAHKLRMGEDSNGLTRRQQAYTCGIVLEGGSDIVSIGSDLYGYISMIKDIACQNRARDEIDSIYDEETLPKWEDEQQMPFVRAYHSGQGSLTLAPTYSRRCPTPTRAGQVTIITRDTIFQKIQQLFAMPGQSTPIQTDSTTQAEPSKRDHFAFGAGRRICPGIQIAEQDMFLAFSRLLWAFEFSAPPGTCVNTDQSAFFGETVRRPKIFPVVITPRSERRVATVEREVETAKQNVFSLYGSYKYDKLPGFDV